MPAPADASLKQKLHPAIISAQQSSHRGRIVMSCHALLDMIQIVKAFRYCSEACESVASKLQRDGGALLPDVHRETQEVLGDRHVFD
jgi:hypothetical protein